ncbi:hypothetical protein D3C85_1545010 [compost metagenome]
MLHDRLNYLLKFGWLVDIGDHEAVVRRLLVSLHDNVCHDTKCSLATGDKAGEVKNAGVSVPDAPEVVSH